MISSNDDETNWNLDDNLCNDLIGKALKVFFGFSFQIFVVLICGPPFHQLRNDQKEKTRTLSRQHLITLTRRRDQAQFPVVGHVAFPFSSSAIPDLKPTSILRDRSSSKTWAAMCDSLNCKSLLVFTPVCLG